MNKLLITLISVASLFSCNNSGDWKNPNSFGESVLMIHDSIASKEQMELKSQLLKILVENTEVKDNKLVFNIDEKYLISAGVSKKYHKILTNQLKETTESFHKTQKEHPNAGLDLKVLFEDYKKEYFSQHN